MCQPQYESSVADADILISAKVIKVTKYLGNNFVSDGHVCNTFCPVLQKLVDVGLKTF